MEYIYIGNFLSFSQAGHVNERLSIDKIRFFRVEQTYAVKTGKWYFEFEAVTGGDMRVGWARPGCRSDVDLGMDDQAFVFDGYKVSPTWSRLSTKRMEYLYLNAVHAAYYILLFEKYFSQVFFICILKLKPCDIFRVTDCTWAAASLVVPGTQAM